MNYTPEQEHRTYSKQKKGKVLSLATCNLRITANRLQFSSPLIITQEEADEALDILYPLVAELKLK